MIVCIAEKPSVAKDIARILGATTSHNGYMEGNGFQVTWTFGHLCTLKEPNDYTEHWKHWSLSALPMIPPRFGIKLIDDDGIKRQFSVIERLMQAADCIVNCGDAGQEGELIQRWVMQKAQAKCPVKRLWISSMTDEAIREGFNSLKDQSEYQPRASTRSSTVRTDRCSASVVCRHLRSRSSSTARRRSTRSFPNPIGCSPPSIATHSSQLQRASSRRRRRASRRSSP